ncbi:MAG: response regulator transcription factor [bacterium]|nr:response regulator transcription factor [bacterium]
METPLIKVGLADDHELMRAGLAQILEASGGIKVLFEASNGVELLEQLEQHKVDVVLLDLEMPQMDGRDALPQIVSNHPDVKVLILSMHDSNAFIVKMMELGASGYLLKDMPPSEVVKATHSVMNDGLYFNAKVSRALLAGLPGSKIQIESKDHVRDALNQRELEVLRHICNELTTAEIAEKMFLSPKTIEGYRKQLLEKTGAKNVAGLAIFAVRHNLI